MADIDMDPETMIALEQVRQRLERVYRRRMFQTIIWFALSLFLTAVLVWTYQQRQTI